MMSWIAQNRHIISTFFTFEESKIGFYFIKVTVGDPLLTYNIISPRKVSENNQNLNWRRKIQAINENPQATWNPSFCPLHKLRIQIFEIPGANELFEAVFYDNINMRSAVSHPHRLISVCSPTTLSLVELQWNSNFSKLIPQSLAPVAYH